MGIPVGWCEVWFAYSVVGDLETMYWHQAFTQSGNVTQSAVNAGFTSYQASFKAHTVPAVNLLGGHVLLGGTEGSIRWDSNVAAVPGTTAGKPLPQNCAFLVVKRGTQAGRRHSGRGFIPGCPAADVGDVGTVLGARQTALNASLAGLLSGGTINSAFGFLGPPVVLHQTGDQTPSALSSLSCHQTIATQRRRLRP